MYGSKTFSITTDQKDLALFAQHGALLVGIVVAVSLNNQGDSPVFIGNYRIAPGSTVEFGTPSRVLSEAGIRLDSDAWIQSSDTAASIRFEHANNQRNYLQVTLHYIYT